MVLGPRPVAAAPVELLGDDAAVGAQHREPGAPDLALDLAQDAFVRAWERLATFERRSRFSTWLYRIAVRLAYDEMGRRERFVGAVDVEASSRDPAPDPEERIEAEATAADLRSRIAELPDLQRAVVVLRAWDGLPYREIAAICGTTETSARVSFHHAIRRLRAGLEEEAGST
ncbi:MAG: sigma-70 family RNA polymerase sigma factor [Gemmatimonadetes bacterium]|nr:sigma-70 family RNA polymerase sigma factor [Gemmatimonadota bacterium]